MAGETGGGSRGCGSDSALGRGMTSQNVAQKRGHREDRRIANRSAISERAAQGELKPIQQLRFVTAMVRDQEVEGSNPFAPTTFTLCFHRVIHLRSFYVFHNL